MSKSILNLVASKAMPFGGVNVDKYENLINDAVQKGHTPVVVEYLHGRLEEQVGYDIAVCLNGEQCFNNDNGTYKEGVYQVTVQDYEGNYKAFLWNKSGRPRGLIVDINSPEDMAYAQRKYNDKSFNL